MPELFKEVNLEKHDVLEENLGFMKPAGVPPSITKMSRDLKMINSDAKHRMDDSKLDAGKIMSMKHEISE